jgi:hypothetical protein
MKGMITKHVVLKRSSGSGMVEIVTRRVARAVATSVAPCCPAPSRIGLLVDGGRLFARIGRARV